jgi:general secretion pathway protein B
MSYILDALKKMEHEKARKVESPGMTRISGELFRDDHRRASDGGGWKIVGVAVAASLVAIVGTWFALTLSRGLRRSADSPPRFSERPAPFGSPVPSLPSSPRVAQAPSRPAALPVPEGRFPKGAERSPLQQRPDHEELSARSEAEASRTDAAGAQLQERPAAASLAPAPADIAVSGVAWQEERRGRRAVINGVLMREGSRVSGARVTEIRKDRVRFSRDGKMFEVTLVSPGDSGAIGSAPPDRLTNETGNGGSKPPEMP